MSHWKPADCKCDVNFTCGACLKRACTFYPFTHTTEAERIGMRYREHLQKRLAEQERVKDAG